MNAFISRYEFSFVIHGQLVKRPWWSSVYSQFKREKPDQCTSTQKKFTSLACSSCPAAWSTMELQCNAMLCSFFFVVPGCAWVIDSSRQYEPIWQICMMMQLYTKWVWTYKKNSWTSLIFDYLGVFADRWDDQRTSSFSSSSSYRVMCSWKPSIVQQNRSKSSRSGVL